MVEERRIRRVVGLAVVEEEGSIEYGLSALEEGKREEGRNAAGLQEHRQPCTVADEGQWVLTSVSCRSCRS